MKVQSQVPINNDKVVLLFFSMMTSKKISEGFVKKLYKTADMVKYIFCAACRVCSPMVKGT